MSTLKYLLLSALCFMNFVALGANRLVHTEPEIVTVKGFAKEILCPGPPNYGNVKKGDKPELYGYLFLNNPIDVDVLPATEKAGSMDQPEKMVRIMQIVLDFKDDTKYWKLLRAGKYIQITGTLYTWVTGHHHVRVMIVAQKMKEISSRGLEWAYRHAKEIKTCKQMAQEDWPNQDDSA